MKCAVIGAGAVVGAGALALTGSEIREVYRRAHERKGVGAAH